MDVATEALKAELTARGVVIKIPAMHLAALLMAPTADSEDLAWSIIRNLLASGQAHVSKNAN